MLPAGHAAAPHQTTAYLASARVHRIAIACVGGQGADARIATLVASVAERLHSGHSDSRRSTLRLARLANSHLKGSRAPPVHAFPLLQHATSCTPHLAFAIAGAGGPHGTRAGLVARVFAQWLHKGAGRRRAESGCLALCLTTLPGWCREQRKKRSVVVHAKLLVENQQLPAQLHLQISLLSLKTQ